MNRTIYLISDRGEKTQLHFESEYSPFKIENILDACVKVFEDRWYELQLENLPEDSRIEVYLNGDKLNALQNGNVLQFPEVKGQLFSGIIGFAQISICISCEHESDEWLYSEFVKVLIRSTGINRVINSMFEYVYENQSEFLSQINQTTSAGKGYDKRYEDFGSQIVLIEEIAKVYEDCYGFFKANSRFKLEQDYILDRIEKVQYIDGTTLQYMAQHPEFLKPEVTGIKYGRQKFIPSKTLMQRNIITYDIYENRVVVNFLDVVFDEIERLEMKITDCRDAINQDESVEDGYIASTQLLYLRAKDILNQFLDNLSVLKTKFSGLILLYKKILDVEKWKMVTYPEPTAVFLNVPQYNRIYDCIVKWFGKTGYDLIREQVMLSFSNAPEIYEAYVLIKLIKQIKECGYEMTDSRSISYPRQMRQKFREKAYHNIFEFTSEDSSITLFYEPVIYDNVAGGRNGLNLYRNNSVSLDRETEFERRGHYYVPDYVIKYSENGNEKYIICDAKFSWRSKVKNKLIPDLAYKYLISISPTTENAELKGLYVLYSLDEGNQKCESFYDRQMTNGKKISPVIEMVPLSEDVIYSNQVNNAREMLKTVLSG